MNIAIHPIAQIFPEMNNEEFVALKEDIKQNGLLEPIWLFEDKVLDGRHRYFACQETGTEPRFKQYEGADPVGFVVSLNLKRRHLNESQRAMVAASLANMPHGGDRKSENQNANLHVDRQQAADMLQVSSRSVASAAKVQDDGAPELIDAVRQGTVSVSAAADVATLPKEQQKEIVARGEKEILEAAKQIRVQKAEKRREEIAALKAANPVAIPAGKYSTIVIDPPWEMQKIERDVAPNQVAFEYPTMTEDELSAFGVADMSADDAHLFCWTTHKHLPMALRLVERWGFRYVCNFVWHKSGGFQPFGLPQYNCEFAIYARKGSPDFVDTKQFFCCFDAPRREHSRKPDEFYDVVRRVTDGPRIDVFSREKRDGFEQFGNETEKFAS